MDACKETPGAPANVCSHLATCPMFPVFETEQTGKIFRKFFCEGKFHDCVRYQKSGRGESVPDMLLPNGAMMKMAR